MASFFVYTYTNNLGRSVVDFFEEYLHYDPLPLDYYLESETHSHPTTTFTRFMPYRSVDVIASTNRRHAESVAVRKHRRDVELKDSAFLSKCSDLIRNVDHHILSLRSRSDSPDAISNAALVVLEHCKHWLTLFSHRPSTHDELKDIARMAVSSIGQRLHSLEMLSYSLPMQLGLRQMHLGS